MESPKRYVKLPVEIEAYQFLGNLEDREMLESWVVGPSGVLTFNWFFNGAEYESFFIKTLEGHMEASKGDFIIKGVQGEFYPCKPDIFEQTYQEACICDEPPTFEQELVQLINRHSMENHSGTPDYILAAFLSGVLHQFDCAVMGRAMWRGESVDIPANIVTGKQIGRAHV